MTSAAAVRTFRLWITSLKQQKHIHTPNFSNINTNTQILTFCVITVSQYIFLFSFYHKKQMQPLQQFSCSWTAVDQTTWHRCIIWDQMEILKTDNSNIPLFQQLMQQTPTSLTVIIFSKALFATYWLHLFLYPYVLSRNFLFIQHSQFSLNPLSVFLQCQLFFVIKIYKTIRYE